ncbi:MAG: hypothetical protein AAF597_08595 [Bacteroidota bacterium]
MNTRVVFAVLLFAGFFSCEKRSSSTKIDEVHVSNAADSLFYEAWAAYQFTDSASGSFLRYDCEVGRLKVSYGNQSFGRLVPSGYSQGQECMMPTGRVPMYKAHSDKYLLLGFSCGLPCWSMMVCPMNETDSIYNVDYYYAYDLKSELIVSWDEDRLDNHPRLVIEHLGSREKQFIPYAQCEDSMFSGYCIDLVEINEEELSVTFNSDRGGDSTYLRKYQILL